MCYFADASMKCFRIHLSQRSGYYKTILFRSTRQKRCFEAAGAVVVPVLVEEGHDRQRVEQFSAHGPAGSVDAVFWYLDGCETLAGQRLQRSKHGASHECLTQLWLVHKGKVLK